jgi:hypothetical protein
MNSKEFIKVLRGVIREEVQLAVRTEMKKLLTEDKTNYKKTIAHGLELEQMASLQSSKRQERKTFSKNPMLNDLLNETATLPTDEWTTMNFRSEMAQAFGGMSSAGDSNIPFVAPSTDLDGRPVNMANEQVAATVNAMTKDYSALMKAIDKKKGIKV